MTLYLSSFFAVCALFSSSAKEVSWDCSSVPVVLVKGAATSEDLMGSFINCFIRLHLFLGFLCTMVRCWSLTGVIWLESCEQPSIWHWMFSCREQWWLYCSSQPGHWPLVLSKDPYICNHLWLRDCESVNHWAYRSARLVPRSWSYPKDSSSLGVF